MAFLTSCGGGGNAGDTAGREQQPDSAALTAEQYDQRLFEDYLTPDLAMLQVKGFVKRIEMRADSCGFSAAGFALTLSLDKGGTLAGATLRLGDGAEMPGDVLHDPSGRVSEMTFGSDASEVSVRMSFDYSDGLLHREVVDMYGGDYSRQCAYVMEYDEDEELPARAVFAMSGESRAGSYGGNGRLRFSYGPRVAAGWTRCDVAGEMSLAGQAAAESDSLMSYVERRLPLSYTMRRSVAYYGRDEIDMKTIKLMNGW